MDAAAIRSASKGGQSNSAATSLAAQALLNTARVQETVLQDEISRYDALLNDDSALEVLRAKRLRQMQEQQRMRKEWQVLGHGTYEELGGGSLQTMDAAKAFFQAAKQSSTMVVHFYRPSTPLCDIYHKHLSQLAPRHMETRFCKINVENCDSSGNGAAFLVERLGVVVLPTLLIVKSGKVAHEMRGFDEVGGEDCSTAALEYVLGVVHKAIAVDEDMAVPADLVRERSVNAIRMRGSTVNRGGDYDEDY